MAEEVNHYYLEVSGAERLSPEEVAGAIADLKRRVDGGFYVIESDAEKIVLGNRRCSFGDLMKGNPSLCMMTSRVSSVIAAQSLDCAKIPIAFGGTGCRVTIYRQETHTIL